LSFRANTAYHGGAPQLNGARFHIFGNLDVLALALNKGEVDAFFNYAATFPAPYVESLRQTQGLSFVEADSLGIPALLGFNPKSKLTSSLGFRRAIAFAIDYERINHALMAGRGAIPGPGLVPPPFPIRESFAPWRQDPEESRRLLKAEGFSDKNSDGFLMDRKGRKVTLALLVRTDLWGDNQTARLISHDLAQLGIEVKVQSVDLSTWQTFNRQGRYDLLLFRTTPWGMMMHAGYGSGYFDARTEGSAVCPIMDSSFSALCDAILCETKPEELAILYRKMQRYYNDNLPAIALCWGKGVYPHSRDWAGFRLSYLEGGIINSLTWKSIQRNYASPRKDQ
jgi:peptide/nickel transport system substrate-binding protein